MKINLIIILIKIKDCIPLIALNNNLFIEILGFSMNKWLFSIWVTCSAYFAFQSKTFPSSTIFPAPKNYL